MNDLLWMGLALRWSFASVSRVTHHITGCLDEVCLGICKERYHGLVFQNANLLRVGTVLRFILGLLKRGLE